jgi:hypothetical protein
MKIKLMFHQVNKWHIFYQVFGCSRNISRVIDHRNTKQPKTTLFYSKKPHSFFSISQSSEDKTHKFLIYFIKPQTPNPFFKTKDISSCVRTLRHLLNHPLIFRENNMQLDKPQNYYDSKVRLYFVANHSKFF